MSSPSYQDVLAIEEAFEIEFSLLLKDAARKGTNAYREFCDEQKKTPYVEIRLTDVKPKDGQAFPLPDGNYIPKIFDARLICRLVTLRGENSDQQGALAGWIRAAVIPIILGQLQTPYHFVTSIEHDIAPRGHDPDTEQDVTELHFNLVIEMKDGIFAG